MTLRLITFVVFLFSPMAEAQDYVPPPLFESPQETLAPNSADITNTAKPTVVTIPKPFQKPLKKSEVPPPPSRIIENSSPSGVVKGPKVMPSVPAKTVESEILFEGGNAPFPIAQPNETENTQTIEESVSPLPAFQSGPNDSLKTVMYFVSHTIDLSESNQNIVNYLILPELSKNSGKKIVINAYASSQNGKANSDRRIALSRALNVRQALIKGKITPSRIDVRSFGAKTDIKPRDRVEILIF